MSTNCPRRLPLRSERAGSLLATLRGLSCWAMRIGVCILPEHPWATAAPLWRAVEDLGFDHAWTYDHLVWGGMPESPWHSTVATLAAAATVTSRIGLGTFVASPNFRHPLLLAKDAVTLDDISGGRLLLGLGAGGDLDSQILGASWTRAERTRRFAEFVRLLDRLLTQDRVEHRGEFFATSDARGLPGCLKRPRVPFVVAANGPRAMRLAARYGEGWVTTGPSHGPGGAAQGSGRAEVEQWWEGVADASARMDEIERIERIERDGQDGRAERPALRRYLSLDSAGPPALASLGFAQQQLGRAAELGFTDVIIHWPRPEPPYQAEVSVLEALAAASRGGQG